MYRGKRYNLILVSLILVISLVVGSSMGMSLSGKPTDLPQQEKTEGSMPVFGEVDANQTFNGLKQPSKNASALNRLYYALAVLEHGKGYTSTSTYDVDILGNNQYFFIKRYRAENYNLVEEWYKMTGLLNNLGLNYFVGTLQTPEGIKQASVHSPSQFSFVDFQNSSYTPNEENYYYMTIEEHTKSKFGVPINNFFAPINAVDSPLERYNKAPGKSFYEITVKLNGDKLKPQFFAAFDNRGPVSIDIVTLNCTFEIDKATGFLLNYKVAAEFDVKAYGLSGTAKFTITEDYLTMNKSAIEEIKPIAKEKYKVEI